MKLLNEKIIRAFSLPDIKMNQSKKKHEAEVPVTSMGTINVYKDKRGV
jgi:hypothetical protein